MLGIIAITLFSITLISCIVLQIPIIYALFVGYLIFTGYGLWEGHSLTTLLKMSWRGVLTVKNIILTFMLIGVITAIWRASGTIAFIIYTGSKVITPSIFILLAFLLCAFLSSLIGTALGTAATMGVICISLARAMGIDERMVGGAIISGIYVGDRCSPMSTSALLVAEITKTDLFENIKGMLKTSWIPFLATCLLYVLLGRGMEEGQSLSNISRIFEENYNLSIWTSIPAILIIVLSFLRINVKKIMFVSIVTAFLVALVFQKESLGSLLSYSFYGYSTSNEELNLMMRGGGIVSMLTVSLIVGISSSYSGIFEGTEILTKIREYIGNLAPKITEFGTILLTAVVASGVACNQSLSSILTNQLCRDLLPSKQRAIALSNTVIVVAALIPWSIAMAVPFRAIAVENRAIVYGFYLYFIPTWNLGIAIFQKRKGH